IEFGDSYNAPLEETSKGPASESSARKKGRTVAMTTEDMQKRRNDVKARTIVLLALPDEHQLRFSNGKGEVQTASVPTASTQVSTASTDVAAPILSHDTISQEMWEAIERLQQGFLQQLQPEWSRFVTIVKQQHKLDEVSYHKLFDILKQYQNEVNELRAEKLARNANLLALVAPAQASQDPFYQSSRSHKSQTPSPKPSIPSRSDTSTRHKGEEIAKPITRPSEIASEEDKDPEQAQRDEDMQKNLAFIAKYFKKIYKPTNNNLRTSSNYKNKNVDTTPRYKNDDHSGQFGTQRTVKIVGTREKVGSQVVQKTGIQCFNCKEYGHFAKECRKPKRVKDSAYHKEKMMLCKQAEQSVPLQAEHYDWLANMDEEVDEQELEAHYSYMAKIQEVPNADSGIDSEPVEQVQNNAEYNVFANELPHSEQSEYVSNTCLVEADDSNVTPNSPDMSLGESISVRDFCLVAIQTKQTEFEKYKAFNDRTVEYDKLERKLNEASGQLAHKDTIIREDVMCSYLQSLSDLDALAELQCMYLHKVKECDCLAQKLSKQTESVSKKVHTEHLQRFAKLEKHSISLEIALQKCKEQAKIDTVCNEKASNAFRKEREQYFEIQDLKAQMQDKNISIRVNHKPNVSRPWLKSNQSRDKVMRNNSQVEVKKTQVEVHPKIPSVSNKIESVTACKDCLNSRTLNANAVCATCNKCLVDSNHFVCVNKMLNDVHAITKKPTVVPISTRKPKSQANKSIATTHRKKKQEEKQIEEEQAAKAQNSKIPICYDDDDDYNSAITPDEPVDSLSMGDEHLNTISATKSKEFIKSCVENLVPNPRESEGEYECDVPGGPTTFSNVLFDADYDFDSGDDQSFSDEDLSKKIYSNPLFDEEVSPMKIDPHPLNVESSLKESMPNHDSSFIISLKIDSLFDEFVGELTLLKSIPPGIDETDYHPKKETRFTKRLLYDNSSPRPPKEIVSDNSNADIESFSPSPIPNEDSGSHIEEIDLPFTPDDPMPSGIEEEDYDSGRDILILEELLDNYSLSLHENESYYFDIPSPYRPLAKPPDETVLVQKGMLKTRYLFLNPLRIMQGVQGVDTRFMDRIVKDEIVKPVNDVLQKRCGSGLSKGLCLICRNNQNSPNDSPSISANSSHNPPHIDERCFECGDVLDGIFCQGCACKSYGKCAHIGYNCPPKVPIISNPKPCNQTMNNEPPQTLSSFDPMCYSKKENSSPCVSKPNSVEESPNIFNPPIQPPIYSCEFYERNAQYGHYCTPQVPLIYPEPGYSQDFKSPQNFHDFQHHVFKIKDAFGNEQYKPKDVQELFHKLLNDVQNIHEELAEYINTPSWNRPTFYNNGNDDDVDYTIAITPVLSTEEPDNSLSMGDEYLNTIPATKSDEVIKSSVEDLVPILSESEGIPDTMCDVHLVNNPTPLEAKDHFEIVINSSDDYSSSNEDSLYANIEYVEASPHDSELISLEVEKIVISEDEEIEDDNLREKLLKVNLLIAKIKALRDNPTPSSEFLIKSSSTSLKSVLEGTDTFDNSLPEVENFCFYLEKISSGSTTTHSDLSLLDPPTDRSDFTHEEFGDEPAHIISPPEYDCFYFGDLPDPGELISSLNSEIHENISSTTRVNLPVEDDYSPLLAYVVWIFLAYLTYPVIPPHLYSFGNEDTIFDPGITDNRFYSFKPGLSHRCETFKKFNTHRSHLKESPMEMLFSTLFPMDQ
nr:hypothetical protein [Tanacetum cinerariifolium]